ncbi:MAG: ankyrin repeat domain-containing protein, partial [Planctomycetota bacterium]
MPLTKLTGKPSDLLRVVLPAAARGDLPSVKRLVGEDPAWLYRVGPHGRTMLWEAVYKQRLETVHFLINAGADVNSAGTYYTPLIVDLSPYCVARRAHNDCMVTLLVENGATTDLHSAAYLGDVRSVERALRAQPDRVDEPYPARRRQPLQRHSVDAPLTKPVEDHLRLIDGRLSRSLKRDIKAAHQLADHARTQWEGEAALLGLDSRYFETIEE